MSGPRFVDNREGNTFAKSICGHLEALRRAGEAPKRSAQNGVNGIIMPNPTMSMKTVSRSVNIAPRRLG